MVTFHLSNSKCSTFFSSLQRFNSVHLIYIQPNCVNLHIWKLLIYWQFPHKTGKNLHANKMQKFTNEFSVYVEIEFQSYGKEIAYVQDFLEERQPTRQIKTNQSERQREWEREEERTRFKHLFIYLKKKKKNINGMSWAQTIKHAELDWNENGTDQIRSDRVGYKRTNTFSSSSLEWYMLNVERYLSSLLYRSPTLFNAASTVCSPSKN